MESNRVEGNLLIDEFMDKVWKFFPENAQPYFAPIGNTNYHTSWDALMPIVEKIEDLGYDTGICGVIINGEKLSEILISPVIKAGKIEVHSRDTKSKIEATWLVVVSFITWYNLQSIANDNTKSLP